MTTYSYSAVDGQGKPARGTMQATSLGSTALRRIKEMGFFPLKISEKSPPLTVAVWAPTPALQNG